MPSTVTQINTELHLETQKLTNPFLGLKSFGPEDHHLFFGREEQTLELLRRLRVTRFLAISGQSGSGKSSLVRSGLVPSLEKGFVAQSGSSWRIATFRPGKKPIHNLAQSIAQRNVLHSDQKMEPNYPEHVETTLRRSSMGIVSAYKDSKISDNLLIVVDQFEELFKYHEGEKASETGEIEATAFVNSLLGAANQRDYPIYIVITMRSDFFGDATEFRGLAEEINKGQYLIPRMKREDIRKAITSPIAHVGASITPRLRSRLLNDVREDADQLPILQHALMRMWDQWADSQKENTPIDLRDYESIGAMENALNEHLEEAYEDLNTTEEEKICEKLFRALTDTSSDDRGVGRTITLAEICQVVEASEEEVLAVMKPFRQNGRHFLEPEIRERIGKDTPISISHEVMMRKWKRLMRWVDEEQKSAEVYTRLAEAANLYAIGESALWRDPELQITTNWFDEDQPNAAWAARYNPNFEEAIDFLNKSKEQATFEVAQIEARRQRELDASKRFNRIVGMAGLIAILLSLMSGYFFLDANKSAKKADIAKIEAENKGREAEFAAKEALMNKKEAEKAAENAKEEAEHARKAEEKADQKAEEARKSKKMAETQAEAAKEAKKDAENQAEAAKRAKKDAVKNAMKAEENAKVAKKAKEKAEGLQRLAEASGLAVKSIRVEDEKSKIKSLLAAEAYHIYYENPLALDYNSDIYSGLYYGLRAIHGINFNAVHDEHKGAVRSIRFNNSGKSIYTTGSDGSLLKWNIKSWSGTKTPKFSIDKITSQREIMNNLAISSNNKWLAVGGKINAIEVYDVKDFNAVPKKVNAHSGKEVLFIEFLPDNQTFVSAAKDKTVKTYNLQSGKMALLDSSQSPITALAIGAGGEIIVWGTENGQITCWNTKTNQKQVVRKYDPNNKVLVTSLGVSPKGDRLVMGLKQTGSVEIWKKSGNTYTSEFILEQHIALVNDIAFSLDGSKMATASYDGTVRIWVLNQLKADYQPLNLDDHDSWAMSVDFNKDGRYVVVGTRKGELRFWNLELNELAEEICSNTKTGLTTKERDLYFGSDFDYQDPCK
ncbi:MAG: hypothetical protein AB8B69_02715 [Chitinophagales bacterium]